MLFIQPARRSISGKKTSRNASAYHIQPLERRQMLADAVLGINLLANDDAAPAVWAAQSVETITKGSAIHVNAFASKKSSASSTPDLATSDQSEGNFLTIRMDWDFGDGHTNPADTSKGVSYGHHQATGWNAAHVYDTVGTYKVTLTATLADGAVLSQQRTLNVVARGGTKLYVREDAPGTNNGLSPENAMNYNKLVTTLASAPGTTHSQYEILFRQGDVFEIDKTQPLTIRGGSTGVRIGSYADGSSDKPILRWIDDGGTQRPPGDSNSPEIIVVSGEVSDFVVDGLQIESPSEWAIANITRVMTS